MDSFIVPMSRWPHSRQAARGEWLKYWKHPSPPSLGVRWAVGRGGLSALFFRRAAAAERVSVHPATIQPHPTIPIIHKNSSREKLEACAAADTSKERLREVGVQGCVKQTKGVWKHSHAGYLLGVHRKGVRVKKENWAREFRDIRRQAPRLELATPTLKNNTIFILTPSGRKHVYLQSVVLGAELRRSSSSEWPRRLFILPSIT